MAVELGVNFPQRWQLASTSFRQQVFDELLEICQSLGGSGMERIVASEIEVQRPVSALSLGPVEQELKRSFLQNADDLIEQHLDKVRQDLRKWLHNEMNRLLQDSLKKPQN